MEAFWVSALLGIDGEFKGSRKEVSDSDLGTSSGFNDDSSDLGYDAVGVIRSLEKIQSSQSYNPETQIKNISDLSQGGFIDLGIGFIPEESSYDLKDSIEEISMDLLSWKNRIEKIVLNNKKVFYRKDLEGWHKRVDNIETKEPVIDVSLKNIIDRNALLKEQYKNNQDDLLIKTYPNETLNSRIVEAKSLVHPNQIKDLSLNSAYLINDARFLDAFIEEVRLLYAQGRISEKKKTELENLSQDNIIIYTDAKPSCDLYNLVLIANELTQSKINLIISIVPNPFVFLGSKRLTVRSVANSLGLISRPPGADQRLLDILKSFVYFLEVDFSYAFDNADRTIDAFSYLVMECARLCYYGGSVKFLLLDCIRKLFEFYANSIVVNFTGDSLMIVSGRERVVINEGEPVQRLDGIFIDITPTNPFIDKILKILKMARMDAETSSFLVGFRSFLNFLNVTKSVLGQKLQRTAYLKTSAVDLISVVTSQITLEYDKSIDFESVQRISYEFFEFYMMYKRLSLVPLASRYRMLDATAMVIPKRLFISFPNFEKYFKMYSFVYGNSKITPGMFYKFIKQMDRSRKPLYCSFEDIIPKSFINKYVVIKKAYVNKYRICGNRYIYTNIIFKKYNNASHIFPKDTVSLYRFIKEKLENEETIFYNSDDVEFKQVDSIMDHCKKDKGQKFIEQTLQIKPVAWYCIREEPEENHPEDLIRTSIYVQIAVDSSVESLNSLLGLYKGFYAIENGFGLKVF